VLYVPKMHGNFMSVSSSVKNRCTVNFGLQNAKVMQDGECIVSANRIGNLYLFQSTNSKCFSATATDGVLLHKRYGHINFSSLREIFSKGMLRGAENIILSQDVKCRTCILSKIHQLPFPAATANRATELLKLIHADV